MTLTNVAFSGDKAVGGAGGDYTGNGNEAGGSFDGTSLAGDQGGGGGTSNAPGGNGGFGGGGGGGFGGGGSSAFGGGAGAGTANAGGTQGGFGGGSTYTAGFQGPYPGGGGGLGAGGAVFVQAGGSLTIAGGDPTSGTTISGGSVVGGAGGMGSNASTTGGVGSALGSGIFLQGDQSVSLAPGAGQTETISDVIADQPGSAGLIIAGPGTVALAAANTYSGGTAIDGGTLVANHVDSNSIVDALGSGAVTLDGGTLEFDLPQNTTAGFPDFLNNAVTVDGAGGTLDGGAALNVGGSFTDLAQPISGTGPLTFTDGTFQLDGDNSGFSGATTIATTQSTAVAVIANGANTLSGASAYTITGANAALVINAPAATSLSIGSLAGDGTVTAVSQTGAAVSLTTGLDNTDTTFSGVIEDNVPMSGSSATLSIDKVGTGTFTVSGANTYSGGTTITAGTLDLEVADTMSGSTVTAGGAGTGTITFAGTLGSKATLALAADMAQPADNATFGNTLANFGVDDALDLKGLTYAPGSTFTAVSFTPGADTGTGTLSVTEGGKTEMFSLTGVQPGTTYYAQEDSDHTGTVIEAVCFASGTLIRTARGDVAVEALRVGDIAVTASGAHRPIRWLGHRKVDCRHHPAPQRVLPVRIAAHALGPNRPARDLVVSPGHSICVRVLEEVLIPAAALINGTTVQQVAVDDITYWHVELDAHDILLAENLAAESYLDMGNRDFFRETGVFRLEATPDAQVDGAGAGAVTHADFCRPFHGGGALVEVVRSQLQARAAALGWTLDASDPFAGLHLVADGERIAPATSGLTARFTVPAGAREVWLACETARPCEITGRPDVRSLGVCIGSLVIADGFHAALRIDLADPLLCIGFHALESGGRRWTTGRARLPAELWTDSRAGFFLRVELAGPALPRWIAPTIADRANAPSVHRPDIDRIA